MDRADAARAVQIRVESDIVAARVAGRDLARQLGFGLADQTRLATAISELTRNVIQYAGKGTCTITDVSDDTVVKIRVVVEDNGPGIPDIALAMKDGYTTGDGLGMGLGGAKRLMDEFDIQSHAGLGTRVSIARYR